MNTPSANNRHLPLIREPDGPVRVEQAPHGAVRVLQPVVDGADGFALTVAARQRRTDLQPTVDPPPVAQVKGFARAGGRKRVPLVIVSGR